MPFASDRRLLALHGLRLKGMAPAERVAGLYQIDVAELEALLVAETEVGNATHRDGRVSGWMLTKDGRAAGEALVQDELATAGVGEQVRAAYHDFHDLNQAMLALCTDWQMTSTEGSGELNDHTDPAYDVAVVARLVAHHEQVAPTLGQLAGALDRLGGYDPRFRAALERVQGGDIDYVTKPIIDSYHTVWFELHEDLLSTLGIERASEADYHTQRGQ